MNSIGRYRDERGLTDEQVADELSALLGRKIGAQGVKLHSAKAKAPKAWAAALGLTDDEPEPFAADSSDGGLPRQGVEDAPTVRESEPPTPPPGARLLPATVTEAKVAQERIAAAYGLIGSGVSQATRNEGYEVVFDSYAPELAEAWVKAAQVNKFAARVVALASAGGPMGDLVMAHVILVIGLVYVSGNGPEASAHLLGPKGSKFGVYRDAVTRERVPPEPEPSFNGSGAEGAASFVEHDPL